MNKPKPQVVLLRKLARLQFSRRKFLAYTVGGASAALLGSLGVAQDAARTSVITGRVVEQGSERALPGVRVSDGKTVAVTDSGGTYRLTLDPRRRLSDLVFASIPSGYRAAVNSVKTPQFYAALQHLGEGDEPEQDFVLIPDASLIEGQGMFIHLTDVHVSDDYGTGLAYERERFRQQIQQLNRLSRRPDFVMVSGDLSNLGRDEEYQAYQEAAADSTHPIFTSVGNHEWGYSDTEGDYAQAVENYRQYQGPEWYSFDHRGYHVVVMETYDAGALSPNGQPEETRDNDQFEWLRQDLMVVGKECPLIVVAHIAMNDPLTIQGTDRYIELLRQHNVKLVLSGHTHRNDVDPNVFPGGFHVVTSAAWSPQDGSPTGFRQVKLGTGGTISFPFKAFGVEQAITLVHPAPNGTVRADSPLWVQVNAYNTTSEVIGARYRLNEGSWQPLQQDGIWTWRSGAGEPLTAGEYRLEVEVTDDAGQLHRTVGACAALVGEASPDPRTGASWSSFHGGPSYTGLAADVVTPPLQLAWSYQSGGAILASSPVVADGTIFIGIKDENGVERNGLVAVEAATGVERWRFRTDAPVDGTPSVVDGRVYTSSIRGSLHALDAQTGELLWERREGVDQSLYKSDVQRGWSYAGPLIAGGLAYHSVSFGGLPYGKQRLFVYDAVTGTERWAFEPDEDPIHATTRVGALALSEDGKTIFYPGEGRSIIALVASTGRQLWRHYETEGRFRFTPAVAGGVVYARTDGGHVHAIDAETGELLRQYEGLGDDENRATPAVANGLLVSTVGDQTVACFDLATGEQRWGYQAGGALESSPAISGETVYVGSKDGYVYALNLTTGEVRWRYHLGAWVNSSPAVSGNMVIVGAYDGNVYGFVSRG